MIDPQTPAAAAPLLDPAQLAALTQEIDKLYKLLATAVTAGGAGFVGSKALEVLKRSTKIKLIEQTSTTRAKQIAGVLMAFAASLGVSFSVAYSAGGDLMIGIHGLTAASLAGHVSKFLATWLAQQVWYETVIKPPAPLIVAPIPGTATASISPSPKG